MWIQLFSTSDCRENRENPRYHSANSSWYFPARVFTTEPLQRDDLIILFPWWLNLIPVGDGTLFMLVRRTCTFGFFWLLVLLVLLSVYAAVQAIQQSRTTFHGGTKWKRCRRERRMTGRPHVGYLSLKSKSGGRKRGEEITKGVIAVEIWVRATNRSRCHHARTISNYKRHYRLSETCLSNEVPDREETPSQISRWSSAASLAR